MRSDSASEFWVSEKAGGCRELQGSESNGEDHGLVQVPMGKPNKMLGKPTDGLDEARIPPDAEEGAKQAPFNQVAWLGQGPQDHAA